MGSEMCIRDSTWGVERMPIIAAALKRGGGHRTRDVGRRLARHLPAAGAAGTAGAAGATGAAGFTGAAAATDDVGATGDSGDTGAGNGPACDGAGDVAGATDGAVAAGGISARYIACLLHPWSGAVLG